jgi:hypothetical protein
MNHLHLENLLNRMTNKYGCGKQDAPFGRQSSFCHGHFVVGNVHLGTVWLAKLLIAFVFTGQNWATPLRASGMA